MFVQFTGKVIGSIKPFEFSKIEVPCSSPLKVRNLLNQKFEIPTRIEILSAEEFINSKAVDLTNNSVKVPAFDVRTWSVAI